MFETTTITTNYYSPVIIIIYYTRFVYNDSEGVPLLITTSREGLYTCTTLYSLDQVDLNIRKECYHKKLTQQSMPQRQRYYKYNKH